MSLYVMWGAQRRALERDSSSLPLVGRRGTVCPVLRYELLIGEDLRMHELYERTGPASSNGQQGLHNLT